jgi:uncharacterized membrane-anchored protein
MPRREHRQANHTALFVAIALLVQIGILGSLAASRWTPASQARTIYLAMRPVDPHDPIRGDYVTLDFPNVNDLRADQFDTKPKAGQTVWITMNHASGATWDVGAVSTTRPPAEAIGKDALMRGRVASIHDSQVNVVYGIEQFWVPKGKGNLPFGKKTIARIQTAPDGTAVLGGLIVDGRPWP